MSKSTQKQFNPLVEKGVPLPESRKERGEETSSRINWPFSEMEYGDSFLLPEGCDKTKAYSALSALKRRKQISKNNSLMIRKENGTYRVWLVENEQ